MPLNLLESSAAASAQQRCTLFNESGPVCCNICTQTGHLIHAFAILVPHTTLPCATYFLCCNRHANNPCACVDSLSLNPQNIVRAFACDSNSPQSHAVCHLPSKCLQLSCATAFLLSVLPVCRCIFTVSYIFRMCDPRRPNLHRLYNFSRNQNWHVAIYKASQGLQKTLYKND